MHIFDSSNEKMHIFNMVKQKDKPTLSLTVYQQLRKDIVQGVFAPGEKLKIDTVAEKYKAGSSAVREALSRLSAERLVDPREQRGFYVPNVALDDWRTLVRTRCWLETRALQESMIHRDAAWEEGIVLACHRLSKCSGSDQWEQAHQDFHRSLLANCGSMWLLEFCAILADHATRYIAFSNAYRVAPRNGQEEHDQLMKVAINGSIDDACAALVAHYQQTLNAIEETFGDGRITHL